MAAHIVVLSRGVFLEIFLETQQVIRSTYQYTTDEALIEFLTEQIANKTEYVVHTRLEFLANITLYFRHEHSIPEALLIERHTEVSFAS